MSGSGLERFALALAQAETEKEVINILKQEGYWDQDEAWHEYGDSSMNYSTIGNQQSSADNALVEKLINSVDAVFLCECLKRKIDPESTKAPKSIAEAQKKFFDIYDGRLSSIDSGQRSRLAKNILLVATGSKSHPSFSVIDKGEGQSPEGIPKTILSLTQSNKIKIPFVQGKFGMGGSGVLRFCSPENHLLLLISKRNPAIDATMDERIFGTTDDTRDCWGVTVVRCEAPRSDEKISRYTYLAPEGKILSFEADELPLLPGDYPDKQGRALEAGTFIKLYEYQIGTGLKTAIYFGLYNRLSLLLPGVALPIRLMERRKEYEAHSYEATLAGLSVRLDDDGGDNLEPEFQKPSTGRMTVQGQKLDYSIYVFKKGKKRENYARKEGIVFSVNGQAHGFLGETFFRRQAVKMDYLSDSILVMVDCSKITRRGQERLFMPSRDRLAESEISDSIEQKLTRIISTHPGLKELRNRRKQEATATKSEAIKQLADAVQDLIKKSPTLLKFFDRGTRISSTYPASSADAPHVLVSFEGKEFPTFFNPVKKHTRKKPKPCVINGKFRVEYETDAENDYFDRDKNPGELSLGLDGEHIRDNELNLWNGIAHLTISIPRDAKDGDILKFSIKVTDISRIEPFTDEFWVSVVKEKKLPGKPGSKRPRGSQFKMPDITEIRRENWCEDTYKDFNFDQFSALKVKASGEGEAYDFFINVDNVYLKTEIKDNTKTDAQTLESRFVCGMVLLGMAALNSGGNKNKKPEASGTNQLREDGPAVDDQISQWSQAVAPALLPMIAHLGDADFTGFESEDTDEDDL